MECQRLQRLVKNWYLQVQDEAMAPARMVAFIENHLRECGICLADPRVLEEADRIKAMVLPLAKVGKSAEDAPEADNPEDEKEEDTDEADNEDEEIDDDEEEI